MILLLLSVCNFDALKWYALCRKNSLFLIKTLKGVILLEYSYVRLIYSPALDVALLMWLLLRLHHQIVFHFIA